MKTYKVIYLKSQLKSFSWNDGLFALYKEIEGIVHLAKIRDDGSIQRDNDGNLNITCTGVNNASIKKTQLTISF